jgi:hypothetical protein
MLPYVVDGTDDKNTAQVALLAYTPETVTMLGGNSIKRSGVSMTYKGNSIWECTVDYGRGDPIDDDSGSFSVDFDTGGGTFKITQSISTTNRYAPAGETAPNHKGAIGVEDDKIEGAEIVVPQFMWTEKHRIPKAIANQAYIVNLVNLVGHTNQAIFRGFAAESVLSMGVTGANSGQDMLDLSFKFSAQPHRTGITIGTITGIAKKAWDYLWVEYRPDPSGTTAQKIPKAVHVEKVYDYADFDQFRIGV